jgi:hypothetical protein
VNPVTLNQLRRLCTDERNTADERWTAMRLASVADLEVRERLHAGVWSGRSIRLEGDHPYREGETVAVIPDAVPRDVRLADALRNARELRVTHVGSDGTLEHSGAEGDGPVLVSPTKPLLEVFEWQRDVINHWLELGDDARADWLSSQLASRPTWPAARTLTEDAERAAVLEAFLASSETLALVQGPPGCGKTHLVAEWIAAALARGLSVASVAFTNRACDGVLQTLAAKQGGRLEGVMRLGHRAGFDRLRKLGAGRAEGLSFVPGRLLATTSYQVTRHVAKALHEGHPVPQVDLLLLDEASQVTLPMFVPLIAAARKVVLVGDDRQLGPVLASPPRGGQESARAAAFDFFRARQAPWFLPETRRMRPGLCALPSEAFYDGALRSVVDLPDWQLPGDLSPEAAALLSPSNGVVRVDDDGPLGRDALLRLLGAWATPQGRAILDAARHRLGTPDEPDIVVSCFYRRQVAALRAACASLPLKVLVDTVERNQGATGLLAVFATAEAPVSSDRGPEWSFDFRRLNVGITRGRLAAYVVVGARFLAAAAGEGNASEPSRRGYRALLGEA